MNCSNANCAVPYASLDFPLDLSATATEFVPRNALSPETVVPENLQPATLLQPSRSSATATSPLNEDKKLLEMFQEVLNEKKQQKKILQDCIKDRDESKATISSLTNEKAALKEEIEVTLRQLSNYATNTNIAIRFHHTFKHVYMMHSNSYLDNLITNITVYRFLF